MGNLKNVVGNYVVGETFWDRKTEMEILKGKIHDGNHIQIVAQRRIGKTSLMRELANEIGKGYICLQVDLQACTKPEQAIVEISAATRPHQKAWEKVKQVFGNAIGSVAANVDSMEVEDIKINLAAGITKGDWKSKANSLLSSLEKCDKPVVIFMDEISIFVNRVLKGGDYKITPERRERADEFMHWLREASGKYNGSITFVIAGSIGIEPVLKQAGLSATLNTFYPFQLKPWSEEIAEDCLKKLAEGKVDLKEGAESKMVELLGCCIPHHVQMFFSHVHDDCLHRKNRSASADDVSRVYEESMLSMRGHAELTHMEERLKDVLELHHFTLATELLSEAAVTGILTKDEAEFLLDDSGIKAGETPDILQKVMGILLYDGYLQEKKGGYVFDSYLLRDWWKKSKQGLYTPVKERKAKKK